MGADDPNDELNEKNLDKIRKNVKDIMDILDKISGYGKVQDPISDIFYGLLTFATAAACAHGTNIIVNKLIDMGYGATTSIEAHGVKATVTITPPPRELQDRLTVGGVVPQYITSNWNAAVAADSTDNPTNGGVSKTKPS